LINLDELVATRDRPALHAALRAVHPADIADFVDGLGHEDRQFVFSLLTDPIAAEVIDEAELDTTRSLAESTSSQRFARVVQHLEADDAAELMTDLDPETSGEILEALSEQAAAAVEEALNYPEGTAGRLMTTSFVALRAGITVGVARQRRQGVAEERLTAQGRAPSDDEIQPEHRQGDAGPVVPPHRLLSQ